MHTIPEEETPDLFEPAPGPAPEQLELFTENSEQLVTQLVTPDHIDRAPAT
ncbi:hypothetical protein D3C76_1689290 [compost metagenome]